MRPRVITNEQRDLAPPPHDYAATIRVVVFETLSALRNKPAPLPAQFLRTEAAAKFLTVDPDTLEVWRSVKGKGPSFRRVGNRVVYATEDLIAWMKAHPKCEGGRRDAA